MATSNTMNLKSIRFNGRKDKTSPQVINNIAEVPKKVKRNVWVGLCFLIFRVTNSASVGIMRVIGAKIGL